MRNILKQTSWLFFAQAASRAISFFYVIFLARNLGVEDFGLYTVALTYFSIISGIADFGSNRYLIREVAKDRAKIPELLWNIVILRLTLTAVFFAVFSLILYSLDPDKLRVSLILLATLAILPQSVALTFDGIFVGLQKLQFSAIALFIAGLSTAVSGFLLVRYGFGTIGAVDALIIGQVIYFLALLILLGKKIQFRLLPLELPIFKKIIFGSLPYGVLAIIGLVSFRIDTLILAYFRGNFETGIYGAAYKFLDAIVFIPAALATASFPVFAKSLISNISRVKEVYFKSIKIMFIVGLAVMLIYILLMPLIMKYLLPDYLPSINVLRVLSLSIPLIFMHVPSGQVLLSTDKYLKKLIFIYLALFTVNLLLYLLFIPVFGAMGAAWVTVVSEVLTLTAFYLFLTLRVFKEE